MKMNVKPVGKGPQYRINSLLADEIFVFSKVGMRAEMSTPQQFYVIKRILLKINVTMLILTIF